MATLVLQIPDESLVQKVKQACKMIVGVASVKVQKPASKREQSQACLSAAEREQARPEVKPMAKKEYDITKTAGYREAMEDVKNGRVYHYDSLKDFYKEMGL
jgi:hypothetical protein